MMSGNEFSAIAIARGYAQGGVGLTGVTAGIQPQVSSRDENHTRVEGALQAFIKAERAPSWKERLETNKLEHASSDDSSESRVGNFALGKVVGDLGDNAARHASSSERLLQRGFSKLDRHDPSARGTIRLAEHQGKLLEAHMRLIDRTVYLTEMGWRLMS
jgi:hypothetical protein